MEEMANQDNGYGYNGNSYTITGTTSGTVPIDGPLTIGDGYNTWTNQWTIGTTVE